MQKDRKCYLGIDVSKLWFDLSLLTVVDHEKQSVLTHRFDNTVQGICQLNTWLKANQVPMDDNSLLVIENTGVYHRLIWSYCSAHNLPIHIGNAAAIKWSLGITRGKDDVTDSQRLCHYCHRHAEDLKATPALDPALLELKDLMTARSRLLSQINSIKTYIKELKLSNSKETQQLMELAHKAALDGLSKSLSLVEKQIAQKVKDNMALKANYELLITVPGIGPVTATYIICCTSNFARTVTGKQLASYAGVVPFSNSSGTSIKGRSKVHKMANKDLKKLLHLSAMSAIKNYAAFRQYYERKKAEGKHSMSILNAIRNKIALRAAAVINNQKPYVNNYQKAS